MATISEVKSDLEKIFRKEIMHSVFLWGPPGIGKSSVVRSVAENLNLELIDQRISQIAPVDLRGLPYVENGISHYAPQSWLPTEGRGILFLDEFNMATPSMMGIAQQLILDRKVGEYTLPDGWFVLGAGNRVEDKAAISQMPSPVANRFIHFETEADLTSFKKYAIPAGFNEQIISFLNFRPQLLFDFNKNAKAWPSPRSWEFASSLLDVDIDIANAIGAGAASEFYSYQSIYSKLPDVDGIMNGEEIPVPREPSLMYAVCGALASRAKTAEQFFKGFVWVMDGSTEDFAIMYLTDAISAMESLGLSSKFYLLCSKDVKMLHFLEKINKMKTEW